MPDDIGAILETGGAAAVEIAASALAARGGQPGKCHNCGAPTIGAYCAMCGQERDTHRRSLGGLAHDVIADIASFDSRILRTITALLIRPGELPAAFREGRTRRYVPAVRLYLFVSLIFFLILDVSGIAIMQLSLVAEPTKVLFDRSGKVYIVENGERVDIPVVTVPNGTHYAVSSQLHFFAPTSAFRHPATPTVVAAIDRLETKVNATIGRNANSRGSWIKDRAFQTLEKLARDPAALNGSLTTWIPRVLFLLLPLFALLLAAFYWRQRKKFYFVDHLVFSLTFHTFAFVTVMVAAGAVQILAGGLVGWLALATVAIYLLLAMKRFYAQNWYWTSAKFGALSLLYVLFFLFPALGGVIALSMIGGSFG